MEEEWEKGKNMQKQIILWLEGGKTEERKQLEREKKEQTHTHTQKFSKCA